MSRHARGLHRWTDGRARQTGGELRAGIDGSGSSGAWLTRRAGTSNAGQTDGRADGQGDGSNRAARDFGSFLEKSIL